MQLWCMPYALVNNIELYYELSGSGPPVVLVPGFSASGASWDFLVDRLSKRATCIVVDNRGSGLSAAPRGPYCIEDLAYDLRDLIEHIGIEKVTVVGHSMGGFVAQTLALDAPELVSGIVLVSSAPIGRAGVSQASRDVLFRSVGPPEDIVRGIVALGLGRRIYSRDPKSVERFVAKLLKHPPRGHGVAGQRRAMNSFDLRERLANISCKTLVIHGNEDELVSIGQAKELAKSISQAEILYLEGVGHFPMIEAVDELVEAIVRFNAT
jgi:pimeloyl-ACP methyl ester carboxylesterase